MGKKDAAKEAAPAKRISGKQAAEVPLKGTLKPEPILKTGGSGGQPDDRRVHFAAAVKTAAVASAVAEPSKPLKPKTKTKIPQSQADEKKTKKRKEDLAQKKISFPSAEDGKKVAGEMDGEDHEREEEGEASRGAEEGGQSREAEEGEASRGAEEEDKAEKQKKEKQVEEPKKEDKAEKQKKEKQAEEPKEDKAEKQKKKGRHAEKPKEDKAEKQKETCRGAEGGQGREAEAEEEGEASRGAEQKKESGSIGSIVHPLSFSKRVFLTLNLALF